MKLNSINGDITLDDGTVLSPPYDSERYQEYATFVNNGGVAESVDFVKEHVPNAVTNFQAKAALMNIGLLPAIEQIVNHPDTPEIVKLVWKQGQEFYRDSQFVIMIATTANLTDEDLDNLFIAASKIKI